MTEVGFYPNCFLQQLSGSRGFILKHTVSVSPHKGLSGRHDHQMGRWVVETYQCLHRGANRDPERLTLGIRLLMAGLKLGFSPSSLCSTQCCFPLQGTLAESLIFPTIWSIYFPKCQCHQLRCRCGYNEQCRGSVTGAQFRD